MTYEVRLDVFEGPFDLLLKLIARRKVEVTDVDLAEITADFLAHLTDLEELDLETATRFLVVAATLVELKAARLLPVEERDELDDVLGEARDLLYARLLEYRAFRDVAAVLEQRHRLHHRSVPRDGGLDPRYHRLVPDAPLDVDLERFARMAAVALRPKPEPRIDLEHIRRSYMSLRDAAQQVLSALERGGDRTEFATLVGDRDRGDRVVLFLAVLELYKLGHLHLEQASYDQPLSVSRASGGRTLDVVLEDDYDGGAGRAPVDGDTVGVPDEAHVAETTGGAR